MHSARYAHHALSPHRFCSPPILICSALLGHRDKSNASKTCQGKSRATWIGLDDLIALLKKHNIRLLLIKPRGGVDTDEKDGWEKVELLRETVVTASEELGELIATRKGRKLTEAEMKKGVLEWTNELPKWKGEGGKLTRRRTRAWTDEEDKQLDVAWEWAGRPSAAVISRPRRKEGGRKKGELADPQGWEKVSAKLAELHPPPAGDKPRRAGGVLSHFQRIRADERKGRPKGDHKKRQTAHDVTRKQKKAAVAVASNSKEEKEEDEEEDEEAVEQEVVAVEGEGKEEEEEEEEKPKPASERAQPAAGKRKKKKRTADSEEVAGGGGVVGVAAGRGKRAIRKPVRHGTFAKDAEVAEEIGDDEEEELQPKRARKRAKKESKKESKKRVRSDDDDDDGWQPSSSAVGLRNSDDEDEDGVL